MKSFARINLSSAALRRFILVSSLAREVRRVKAGKDTAIAKTGEVRVG